MANTPHLNITLLEQSQAQKEVTVNEALYRIDALLNSGVIDKDLAAPPASPAQGDVYIVAASPTGAWSGKAKSVAYFDQIWRFIAPNEGLMLWVTDENKRYLYNGSAWEVIEAGTGGSGDMEASTYDPANISQQVVGTTAPQTLTSPAINGTLSGDAMLKLCQARLTLTSGLPVTSADVLAATAVYLTPFHGNHMALYDGTTWKVLGLTEITHGLSGLAAGKPYDVFAYISSGAVAAESLAWTNDTTRATALAIQDGVLVKSGDATRRYIGTFYTSATGQTEDSAAKRYLWNLAQGAQKPMLASDATISWAYSTATYRQVNGNTANQLDMVIGHSNHAVTAHAGARVINSTSSTRQAIAAIGLDSSTTNAAQILVSGPNNNNFWSTPTAFYTGFPGVGRHTLRWLEQGAGADTQTWYGSANNTGISGTIIC